MRILDKNKDYYDYAAEKEDGIVFDRNGSVAMERTDFIEFLKFEMSDLSAFVPRKFAPRKNEDIYFLIVAGDFQTLVSYNVSSDSFNYIHRYNDSTFFQTFAKYNILSKAPLMIMRVEKTYRPLTGVIKKDLKPDMPRSWRRSVNVGTNWEAAFYNRSIIVKPILKNMGLSGLISAKVLCQDLENWLFHNTPQPEPQPIPDEMKAENHGFDGNSFRGKFTGRKFKKKAKEEG